MGRISPDFWCLRPSGSFVRVNGEKQVHLQCFGSSSPACIYIPLLLICFVPWITNVEHSRADAVCTFLPMQGRWVVWPQLQSFGCFLKLYCLESFCLRGCLIPSLMHQAGQEPVSALNPVCWWMLPHQASRASQRQGDTWHLRNLLKFRASSYQMVCTAPGATDCFP